MLGSKEHYELMEQFEREFRHLRVDREQDQATWRMGHVYQNGEVNELYGAYIRGYSFGKCIERDMSTPVRRAPQ